MASFRIRPMSTVRSGRFFRTLRLVNVASAEHHKGLRDPPGCASMDWRSRPSRCAPRELTALAADSCFHLSQSAFPAFRDGLRGDGAWVKSTGIAREREHDEDGSSGRAKEICKKRLAHTKLSAKAGPSGSRRHDVPAIWRPRLRRIVSSIKLTTGLLGGSSETTAATGTRSSRSRSTRCCSNNR